MKSDRPEIKRRSFLDIFIGGAIVGTILAAVGTAIAFVLPPRRMGSHRGNPTLVAPVARFAVGSAVKVWHYDQPVIVMNTKLGYFALSAKCTHLGCLVNWDEKGQQLRCPCHNAVFDIQGNVLKGPAPKPLPSFEVSVIDDKVYLV